MATTKNGVDDDGIIEASNIKHKAQLAHAAVITAAQIYIALRRWRIQEQYLDIAEAQRNHYKNTFRPVEDMELKDALERFEKDTNLENLIDHVTSAYVAFRLQNTGAEYRAVAGIGQYHTGILRTAIQNAQISEATGATYAKIIGEYKLFLEEQNRIDGGIAALTQALARGRSLGAQHLSIASVNSNYLNALNFEYDYAGPVTELNDQQYQPMGLAEKYNPENKMPVNPQGALWGWN